MHPQNPHDAFLGNLVRRPDGGVVEGMRRGLRSASFRQESRRADRTGRHSADADRSPFEDEEGLSVGGFRLGDDRLAACSMGSASVALLVCGVVSAGCRYIYIYIYI